MLEVRQLFEKESSTYSYIVFDKECNKAIIIDPVKETFERDTAYITELELKLVGVFETHLHADHITSASKLSEKYNCPIYISENAPLDPGVNFSPLADGQLLKFSKNLVVKALLTPGHTSCSMCFVIQDRLFSGDTLLIRGCGRTDFQNGSNKEMFHSVRDILFALPDSTKVYPGHDYQGRLVSTIKEEKEHNPRLGLRNSFESFSEIMDGLGLAYPKKIDVSLPGNKRLGKE